MVGKALHRNPFKPTAGMNPPELVGRTPILDDFSEALENGPGAPERLMRISGARGTGKTVLLNALGDIARNQGFTVIDVAANPGFCQRIADQLNDAHVEKTVTVEPSILGVSLGSVSFDKSIHSLGNAMLEASSKGGLLITLDEIQDANFEEMKALGNEVQLLIRKGANIAFVFAGLPTAVDEVIEEKTLTFLQRAKNVELERLLDSDVLESLGDTFSKSQMNLSDYLAAYLTEAVAGYPFMLQLIGYYTWQAASRRGSSEIVLEDADSGIAKARESFTAMVLEPALRHLSDMQLEYLKAMAQCGEFDVVSGDVAEAMNRKTGDVAAYRKRLIDASILEPTSYGKASFAIPYMRDYLLIRKELLE